MIGESGPFRQTLGLVSRMARYDVPVLIRGETGTGKELAARAIHYQGSRSERPFVAVNCGAIPDSLIENELFGHDSGAFTDARNPREGLIACAQGGTLFLDEVDALSAKAQVTLLRFLQDQQYRPLGGGKNRQANVRIIAATNADLAWSCERRVFRLDLFYRLCILELAMPPLREREGDAALLGAHFASRIVGRHGGQEKSIDAETLAWFECYAWPGNVRELENLVCRAVLLGDGEAIHIPPPGQLVRSGEGEADRPELGFSRAKALAVQEFERRYIASVLARTQGNVTRAAQIAGKERRAFGKLIKKHAIGRAGDRSST